MIEVFGFFHGKFEIFEKQYLKIGNSRFKKKIPNAVLRTIDEIIPEKFGNILTAICRRSSFENRIFGKIVFSYFRKKSIE